MALKIEGIRFKIDPADARRGSIEIRQQLTLITRSAKSTERAVKQSNTTMNSSFWLLERRMRQLRYMLAGGILFQIARGIVRVASGFESLRAQLRVMERDADKANKVFEGIKDFALKTPFNVENIVAAYVKLRSAGITPTVELLTDFGNLAGAQIKDIEVLAQAAFNSIQGLNRMLKQFGINAKQSAAGFEAVFRGKTFFEPFGRGTRQERADAVIRALRRMAQEFPEGMSERVATYAGAVEKLEDALHALADELGRSGLMQMLRDLVTIMSDLAGTTRAAPGMAGLAGMMRGLREWLNDSKVVGGQSVQSPMGPPISRGGKSSAKRFDPWGWMQQGIFEWMADESGLIKRRALERVDLSGVGKGLPTDADAAKERTLRELQDMVDNSVMNRELGLTQLGMRLPVGTTFNKINKGAGGITSTHGGVFPQSFKGMNEYSNMLEQANKKLEENLKLTQEMKTNVQVWGSVAVDSFTSGLASIIDFTGQSKISMSEWAASLASSIARVIAEMIALKAISGLVGFAFGGTGIPAFFNKSFGISSAAVGPPSAGGSFTRWSGPSSGYMATFPLHGTEDVEVKPVGRGGGGDGFQPVFIVQATDVESFDRRFDEAIMRRKKVISDLVLYEMRTSPSVTRAMQRR